MTSAVHLWDALENFRVESLNKSDSMKSMLKDRFCQTFTTKKFKVLSRETEWRDLLKSVKDSVLE